MNWEQIDNLLKEQIANKSDMSTGYNQIKQMLIDQELAIADIDIQRLKKDFENWLVEVLEKEPIPKNIKSVYFGLTTMKFPEFDDGKEQTTLYIAGSRITPEQDVDWACDTEYFPVRRYVLLDAFSKIDETVMSSDNLRGDYELLIFNGLLNLLVLDFMKSFKDKLLAYQENILGLYKIDKRRDYLYFGAGFDSGDVYLLGKLIK